MADDVTAQARQQWGRAAAGWGRWADAVERDDAARYVDAAAVEVGDRVLEVGAGAGEQTLVLAEQVGPRGVVVATDLCPEMVDVAARRVGRAGFDNVEFVSGSVDAIDFEEASFDACISGFTWEFLADPIGAAAKVMGLLSPRGRFAASVWGPMPDVPMRSTAVTVILSELELPQPAQPEGADLADPREFERVLNQAGFGDVTVTDLPVVMRWATPVVYAQWMREIAPQLDDVIAAHDPQRTEQIWDAVASAAAHHVVDDGTVRMVNQAFLGVGTRPG